MRRTKPIMIQVTAEELAAHKALVELLRSTGHLYTAWFVDQERQAYRALQKKHTRKEA